MKYLAFVLCVIPGMLAGSWAMAQETETNRCHLVPQNGPCKALLERAYFDQTEQRCRTYYYDGCGPVVPYETIEQCKAQCETAVPGGIAPSDQAGESK